MKTKQEIINNVKSRLTANSSVTTRTEHEKALITEAESLLEAFYGDIITETESDQNIFTTTNNNLAYNIQVMKVGRSITLSGYIQLNGSTSLPSISINMPLDNYKNAAGKTFYGNGIMFATNEPVSVSVKNVAGSAELFFFSQVQPEGYISFSITYGTEL